MLLLMDQCCCWSDEGREAAISEAGLILQRQSKHDDGKQGGIALLFRLAVITDE